ncbi:aldehyde dehydrogenase family protein [uncultured Shewanella sp.]|uniref:aldehyde dehydrogenase family protein n=1 Tax=uncultured Shewanella sp. TaxID=173975 RepID=UPI002614E6FE|nr:aldehyde dehydrogenase family protein [uncultured Shewanella sp.]
MNRTLKSINPATLEVVGEVEVTSTQELHKQVRVAREALKTWREISLDDRAKCLENAGQALVDNAEDFGEILSKEMGKPLKSGIGEVRSCGNGMAGKVKAIKSALQTVVHDTNTTQTRITYRPLGVVGVISPWNYPMAMPQWMVIPALMAGNTVILKPSEETPLIAQCYVDTLNQFLPAGVLQIAHGADEQGKALVEADINLITFTGSRAVGIDIMKRSADGLKRLILELGGKDPLIVLRDADIESAADFAVSNSVDNSGQMCVSTERVFVHEDIADDFELRVTELSKKIRVGPWNEAGVQMGPMIHSKQSLHVANQIDDAISKGARLLFGGKHLRSGYVMPTVLAGVTEDMSIAGEETFGPVICITRYRDLDDAVCQANDTVYGLGAVVFGRDEVATELVASRLEAGMIGINKSVFGVGDNPWVGAKQSGFGYHGSGDGYRQFSQVTVISKALD